MKNAWTKMALGAGLAVATAMTPLVPVASAARLQEHRDAYHEDHPEWHTNTYYRTGNREGWEDHQRRMQRKEHRHDYHNDEDRRAHDYGYQQGWGGTRYDQHDHH